MNRLTVAALYRMAKTAAATEQPTVTIVTHTDTGERYAAWGYGCIHLPQRLLEELAFPTDGHHQITSKGQLSPADPGRLPVDYERILALLDAGPRVPAKPNGWLFERGVLTMRLLDVGDRPAIAVQDDQWQAWTRALPGPAWQVSPIAIAWADTDTSRAHGLLTTIHHQFVPAPPKDTP